MLEMRILTVVVLPGLGICTGNHGHSASATCTGKEGGRGFSMPPSPTFFNGIALNNLVFKQWLYIEKMMFLVDVAPLCKRLRDGVKIG